MNVNNCSLINNNSLCSRTKIRSLMNSYCDTVSFGAMKKHQFHGTDLLVVNKFLAPIEKFDDKNDFNNWCKSNSQKLLFGNYSARSIFATIKRRIILNKWNKYLMSDKNIFSDAQSLIIAEGLVKNLRPDNDELPLILNKNILTHTIAEIDSEMNNNPNIIINFAKRYSRNMQNNAIDEIGTTLDSSKTGWVIIPSKIKDSQNFAENVERAKILSHHNWCTKTTYAEPYLKKGDFHVYLENGYPKLGIRFVDDKIEQIQGVLNNYIIPIKYLDIVREHVKPYSMYANAQQEIIDAIVNKEKLQNFLQIHFPQGIENASIEDVFNAVGIDTKKNKDGKLIISEYRIPSKYFSYEDMGISENDLLKDVVKIEGDADFTGSKITNLGSLIYIGGNADFKKADITRLNNLQVIDGNANFRGSYITTLEKLKYIGGNANFWSSRVKNLGNLAFIGGDADFTDSKIENINKLSVILGLCTVDSATNKKIIDMLKEKNFKIAYS